jgi:hypothetical protein
MSESLSSFDVQNATVDVTQTQTVDFWTTALGVDEHRLRTAVAEVGTSAQDVRSHLGLP